MDENKPFYSKISKEGPFLKIEGGFIFKHPFKSFPLEEYDETKALKEEEPFMQSIVSVSNNWFDRFPNCCDTHKQLKRLEGFDKSKFAYIPQQIVNNIKFAADAFEQFIGKEDGINEIKDYLDYLIESFGIPDVGGHIFELALKSLIEGVILDDQEFTDDQRLELLEHLEPKTPPIDLDDRDIGILFSTFQKWLTSMPNIGKFKELKKRLTGKIPMNIFTLEPRYNKYLKASSFRTRSRVELLEYLNKMTNDLLILTQQEVKQDNYSKEKLIMAAEERLRIKQEKLLGKQQDELELGYLKLIEDWLSIIIEYYQVINQVIEEQRSEKAAEDINEIKGTTHDILSRVEELQIEISSLCSSDKILNWLKTFLPSEEFKSLLQEIENLDENDVQGKQVLEGMISQMQVSGLDDYKFHELKKKTDNLDLGIKKKLKVSIPLFLFTKYEAEIELSAKHKIPVSFKELTKIIF